MKLLNLLLMLFVLTLVAINKAALSRVLRPRRKTVTLLLACFLGLGGPLAQPLGIFISPSVAGEIENPSKEQKTTAQEQVELKGKTSAPATPIPSDFIEWMKLLQENPRNKEIWSMELKRVDEMGKFLLTLKEKSDPGVSEVDIELEIANNAQLKGIALRHLERYAEALQALNKSVELLDNLSRQHKCQVSLRKPECSKILDQSAMTYSFLLNVCQDMKDETNEGKYLTLYLRALFSAMERAIFLEDKKKMVDTARKVDRFYSQLFFRISWIPGTKQLRVRDPRDFADTIGIGIGSDLKYGMTNPEEDEATFLTLLYTHEKVKKSGPEAVSDAFKDAGYESIDEIRANTDIEKYVREQMDEGNFEPAAKYLYFKHIAFGFPSSNDSHPVCKKESSTDVTFEEVNNKLRTVPLKTIAPSTVQVIELMHEGNTFLKKHCRN